MNLFKTLEEQFMQRHYLLGLGCVLMVFLLNGEAVAGMGDFLFAKGRGIDLMNNGQYQKAIEELEKVSGKQDVEIQLALIKCYMMAGNDGNAGQIAGAVVGNREYKNAGDQTARVYLDALQQCQGNKYCLFDRLIKADGFASGQELKNQIGNLEKSYAGSFDGGYKQQLLDRAVRNIGHGAVYVWV
jgi:hypothetical protein